MKTAPSLLVLSIEAVLCDQTVVALLVFANDTHLAPMFEVCRRIFRYQREGGVGLTIPL